MVSFSERGLGPVYKAAHWVECILHCAFQESCHREVTAFSRSTASADERKMSFRQNFPTCTITWFNFICKWTLKHKCLKQEVKQIWWVFPSLPLSKEKKKDASQGTWQSQDVYIFPSMNLQTSGPASGVRRLRFWLQPSHRTLDLVNDSSKGKVPQDAASFSKVMEKRSWKTKLFWTPQNWPEASEVQDFSLLILGPSSTGDP